MPNLEPGQVNTLGGLAGLAYGLVVQGGDRGANAVGYGVFGYLVGSLLQPNGERGEARRPRGERDAFLPPGRRQRRDQRLVAAAAQENPSGDMLIAENVSKQDARELQRWWSRKGVVVLKAPQGRGPYKGRFSVWLQRTGGGGRNPMLPGAGDYPTASGYPEQWAVFGGARNRAKPYWLMRQRGTSGEGYQGSGQRGLVYFVSSEAAQRRADALNRQGSDGAHNPRYRDQREVIPVVLHHNREVGRYYMYHASPTRTETYGFQEGFTSRAEAQRWIRSWNSSSLMSRFVLRPGGVTHNPGDQAAGNPKRYLITRQDGPVLELLEESADGARLRVRSAPYGGMRARDMQPRWIKAHSVFAWTDKSGMPSHRRNPDSGRGKAALVRVRHTPYARHPYTARIKDEPYYGWGNTPAEARAKLDQLLREKYPERYRNPGDSKSAQLYEDFHGAPPAGIKKYQLPTPAGPVMEVGRIIEVVYQPEKPSTLAGKQFQHAFGDRGLPWFSKDPKKRPILATDGKELYIIRDRSQHHFSDRGIIA